MLYAGATFGTFNSYSQIANGASDELIPSIAIQNVVSMAHTINISNISIEAGTGRDLNTTITGCG